MAKLYDIFISYQTEDVNIARSLSERLIAGGLQVWFNEYELLDPAYFPYPPPTDDLSNEPLKNELRKGVFQSDHAIVLTNDRWAKSPFCHHEMHCIMQRISKDNILQVCIPESDSPVKEWPILAQVQSVICNPNGCNTIAKIIQAINHKRWFSTTILLHDEQIKAFISQQQRILFRYNYSLDIKVFSPSFSFDRIERIKRFINSIFRFWPVDAYNFTTFFKSYSILLEISCAPYNTALGQVDVVQGKSEKDIGMAVRGEYIKYANSWVKKRCGRKPDREEPGGEVIGVHVVSCNIPSVITPEKEAIKTSQFGVTFSIDYGSKRNLIAWVRRYVIRIPAFENSLFESSHQGEISLEFIAALPTFKDFCALTEIFDTIVSSLNYYPVVEVRREDIVGMVYGKVWITLFSLFLTSALPGGFGNIVLSALVGAFLVDLSRCAASRSVRRSIAIKALKSGGMVELDNIDRGMITRYHNLVWGGLLDCASNICLGIMNLPMLIIIIAMFVYGLKEQMVNQYYWGGLGALVYLSGWLMLWVNDNQDRIFRMK